MLTRRHFLHTTGAGFALAASGLLLPQIALADDKRFWQRDRVLSIYRPSSKETKHIKFFSQGKYVQDGYKALCWMMRDVVDGNQMVGMDINLINLLFAQQQYLRDVGRSNPMLVLHSGYRTRRHNSSLEGAARNSKHLHGKAGDFHIRQASKAELVQLARRFRVGGIGAYSTFIHNDIGRYREW